VSELRVAKAMQLSQSASSEYAGDALDGTQLIIMCTQNKSPKTLTHLLTHRSTPVLDIFANLIQSLYLFRKLVVDPSDIHSETTG
jgi:hypothetical protein